MKHWAARPPVKQLLLARHGASALALGITNRSLGTKGLGTKGPGNGLRRCQNRPGNMSGNPRPSTAGACPRHTSLPRTALVVEGSGKRWNSPILGVPALHREAECDTTENIGRQHSVHTRKEPMVQGSVACRSQSAIFAHSSLRSD